MPLTINVRFASKNEEPSHDTPRIEIIAVIPLFMMLPLSVSSAEALKTIMVSPAIASIRIMIAIPMLT